MADPSIERLLGDLKGELGEIKGQMQAMNKSMADSWDSRRKIYDELGQLKSSVQKMETEEKLTRQKVVDVKDCIDQQIKPNIEDFKRIKNRGWGLLAGVSIASGGAGAAMSKVLSKLGIG